MPFLLPTNSVKALKVKQQYLNKKKINCFAESQNFTTLQQLMIGVGDRR